MSIQTVLCAVDVSNGDIDLGVLRKAQHMAEIEGASLDVITVVPDFGMSIVSDYFEEGHHEKATEEATSLLHQLVEKALGPGANEKVRHVVATGNAYEEILKTAEMGGAGLIVIGAHTPDLKDYLLGPNAARVVRHSNCSVYVVRD